MLHLPFLLLSEILFRTLQKWGSLEYCHLKEIRPTWYLSRYFQQLTLFKGIWLDYRYTTFNTLLQYQSKGLCIKYIFVSEDLCSPSVCYVKCKLVYISVSLYTRWRETLSCVLHSVLSEIVSLVYFKCSPQVRLSKKGQDPYSSPWTTFNNDDYMHNSKGFISSTVICVFSDYFKIPGETVKGKDIT